MTITRIVFEVPVCICDDGPRKDAFHKQRGLRLIRKRFLRVENETHCLGKRPSRLSRIGALTRSGCWIHL